jgi:isoquinoline 1-oxidoreductase subunit alpha
MELKVNGKTMSVDMPGETPVLWALRDELNLTGTKYGCGISLCGACTIHVDGRPTRACITPLSSLQGKEITTIEGLGEGLGTPVSHAVQTAWEKLSVPQCGYCQSGQIMAATALLEKNKKTTDAQIDDAMSGNICRCGTYPRIRAAIHEVAKQLV